MTFPAYLVYKDSGVEWLGEVPAHWEEKPFFSLISERSESNSGMKQDNLLSLSYGRIINKDINTQDGLLPVSFETYQLVYPGDIVFRLTDLQNDKKSLRSAIVRETGIITSAYLAVVCRKILPEFASHLFRAYDTLKVFYSMGGGLRQSMKYSDMKWLPILLPHEQEQTQIARFLDHETARINALIEEQQRLIELLKEKRQAVISHAVTKGLDPTVPMKDSGVEWLGEVPAHWELTRVGWQCIVGNGCTPSRDNQGYWDDGHYPWLNSSKVNLERVVEADQFVTRQALKECALPIVKPGSVLMAITGEGKTRGMVTITEIEATINQHVAFIEPRGSELLPTFLHDWLNANYSRLRHDSADWGSTKAAITCGDIRAYPLPLPPRDEQEAIYHFICSKSSLIDGLISTANENVNLLYERRSSLISAAVTGKIDVRGWLPPASARSPELAQEAV